MNQSTRNNLQPLSNPIEQQTLADLAKQRLLALNRLSMAEQNRALMQIATAEGWKFWHLGGFHFADSSVLCHSGSAWQSLTAEEAQTHLQARLKKPLEVRLLHAYRGHDGRDKGSIAEARFSFAEDTERWRLVVEYEAYIDSPLYGFSCSSFAQLSQLELSNLRIDTPQPSQRWRLKHIAQHPDWLEVLRVSRRG